MGIETLETEALKLDVAERALLAERLLLSLDAPVEEENLSLWVAEAQRRLTGLRTGTVDEHARRHAGADRNTPEGGSSGG